MTASEVKLRPPILCIAAAATDRQNTTVQDLATEANFHTEFVIMVASLRPSPHLVAVHRDGGRLRDCRCSDQDREKQQRAFHNDSAQDMHDELSVRLSASLSLPTGS